MQYIEQGNFEKRLWSWSYNGSERPKPKDRILGQYNQTTKSGDINYRGLTIKYFYIDPQNSSRSTGDSLKIRCEANDFQSYAYFPDSICGKTFFKQPYRPIGISPMGNSGRFPRGKASCDRIALPNLRCMLGVLEFPKYTE